MGHLRVEGVSWGTAHRGLVAGTHVHLLHLRSRGHHYLGSQLSELLKQLRPHLPWQSTLYPLAEMSSHRIPEFDDAEVGDSAPYYICGSQTLMRIGYIRRDGR